MGGTAECPGRALGRAGRQHGTHLRSHVRTRQYGRTVGDTGPPSCWPHQEPGPSPRRQRPAGWPGEAEQRGAGQAGWPGAQKPSGLPTAEDSPGGGWAPDHGHRATDGPAGDAGTQTNRATPVHPDTGAPWEIMAGGSPALGLAQHGPASLGPGPGWCADVSPVSPARASAQRCSRRSWRMGLRHTGQLRPGPLRHAGRGVVPAPDQPQEAAEAACDPWPGGCEAHPRSAQARLPAHLWGAGP